MAFFAQNPTNTLTNHDLYLEARAYFKEHLFGTEYSEPFFTDDMLLYDGIEGVGKVMELNKAISYYVNEEEECFYTDIMNETIENFAIEIGDTYTNFGYNEEQDMLYFNRAEDLEAVITAFKETVGKSIIEVLADDYWFTAKKYLLMGYQMA